MNTTKWRAMLLAATSATIATAIAPAHGQDIATAEGDLAGSIVVTGTRIVRNGNDAPTPVSVITAAEIQRAALPTIADFVNQLPALSGSTTPKSHGNTVTNGGANLLNLRSLGVNRTLTLLNGRRVTPSTLTGSVDINTLPTGLVERVDIVTGGASASWGSDAVAGVVNFILDTKFQGIKGHVQGGISQRGDAGNVSADLSAGTAFAGGRGHVVVSGNYTTSKIAHFGDRGWYKGQKIFANPAFTPGGNQPARLILPNSSLLINDYGLVTTGPLRGTAFDANGQVATTAYPFGPVVSGVFQSGGPIGDVSSALVSVIPLEQGAVYGHMSYALTDDISLFAEVSYGDSKATITSGPLRRQAAEMVKIDNIFLPVSVRDDMLAAGVTSIPVYSNKTNLGLVGGTNRRSVLRGLVGVDGKFGNDWMWTATYQSGLTKITTDYFNNFLTARYLQSVDAVGDSITGAPICRSTLSNPTNGCVAINPFGGQPLTDAQRAWFIGHATQHMRIRQEVAEANIQGSPFSLPAGEVSVALGVEYRKESASADADPFSQSISWFVGNFAPFDGAFNVKEGFFETSIPILKDSAIGKSLDFNGAVRLTDYSSSGTVTTWKLGGTYQPIDGLQFRVTRSRDIRAPNLNDLFLTRISNTVAISDPFRGGANAQFLQFQAGNPALKPEIAKSLTVGAVYRPAFLPGASLSVDYYNIKIGNAIATSSSQQIANQCYAGNTLFCDVITRDPDGTLATISVIPFNAASQSIWGIDTEIGYRTNLGTGSLDLRAMVNYVGKAQLVSPSGLVTSISGELGNNLGAIQGIPHFRGLATATYATERFDVQLKGRFIGGGRMERDYGPQDVNRNDVPGVLYLDAFIGTNVEAGSGKAQLFLAIDNLLDKDPPVVVNQDNMNAHNSGTNLAIYDAVGRAYRVGARFQF